MHIESFRSYCLSKHGVAEEFPFGPDTLVFKVAGKLFALAGLDETDFRFNVKCDPERAESLREQHPAIRPGYHQNKRHWNTVYVDGSLSEAELREQIDHSYDLVVAGLPRVARAALFPEDSPPESNG